MDTRTERLIGKALEHADCSETQLAENGTTGNGVMMAHMYATLAMASAQAYRNKIAEFETEDYPRNETSDTLALCFGPLRDTDKQK